MKRYLAWLLLALTAISQAQPINEQKTPSVIIQGATGNQFAPGANIQKINDRMFVGGATANDGTFPPVALDWLSQYEDTAGYTNFTLYGALAVLTGTNPSSTVAATFGAQSLNATNPSAATIAIESWGICNNATLAINCWAYYGEGHKRNSLAKVWGGEVDLHTGFTSVTPSPYAVPDTIGWQVSDGAGVGGASFTGHITSGTPSVLSVDSNLVPQLTFQIGPGDNVFCAVCPAGLQIASNGSGSGGLGTYNLNQNSVTAASMSMAASLDFAASVAYVVSANIVPFKMGMFFGANSIFGTDGTNGVPSPAIGFATNHAIDWYKSGGVQTAQITSTIATATNAEALTFSDQGLLVTMLGGGGLMVVPPVTSSVNYIEILGAATGGNPLITSIGSDPNPNLRFQAQGSGTINTLSPFKTANGLERLFTTTITAATYTVLATDNHLVFNATGTCTVTLPAASSFSGREITMRTIAAQTVVSASSNVVPLAGGAAGTAILAATAGKWAYLVSDGTNWEIHLSN